MVGYIAMAINDILFHDQYHVIYNFIIYARTRCKNKNDNNNIVYDYRYQLSILQISSTSLPHGLVQSKSFFLSPNVIVQEVKRKKQPLYILYNVSIVWMNRDIIGMDTNPLWIVAKTDFIVFSTLFRSQIMGLSIKLNMISHGVV